MDFLNDPRPLAAPQILELLIELCETLGGNLALGSHDAEPIRLTYQPKGGNPAGWDDKPIYPVSVAG